MREAENGLRSRLRVLQIARLEGWEVARNYVEILERATEDPFLIEARRQAAHEATESDSETESESEIESFCPNFCEQYY